MSTADKKPTAAWIGTGVMGRWMCEHLMDAGYHTVVYNRTKSKAQPLIDKGAVFAGSPKEAAEQADIIFTIVGFTKDVREVYFSDTGILAGAKNGSIVVDMTTTNPSLAVEIFRQAEAKGISSIDAPVSGGDVGAREARLTIMSGGDKTAFDQVLPLFEVMGRNINYLGEAGAGQHTKACNQIVIAGTMVGVCESLLYGYKAGLSMEQLIETISKGAAGCWTLDNLAPRIAKHDYDPGFIVEHFIKDMGIALQEAQAMELSLPGLALAHQLYVALKAQGRGKDGTQALILALDALSNAGFSRS